MRVFDLDLVDHVDAKIHVHGFVTQDVLELFSNASHLVASTHGQNLGKANIEEDAFEHDVERDQFTQKFLVVFRSAGLEIRISQVLGKRQRPFRLACDRRQFAIHVEDFTFVQAQ